MKPIQLKSNFLRLLLVSKQITVTLFYELYQKIRFSRYFNHFERNTCGKHRRKVETDSFKSTFGFFEWKELTISEYLRTAKILYLRLKSKLVTISKSHLSSDWRIKILPVYYITLLLLTYLVLTEANDRMIFFMNFCFYWI